MPDLIDSNIWKHFKGGLYKLLLIARDSETEEPVVVYVALKDGSTWTRKLSHWTELVQWPDGSHHARFVRVDCAPPV